MPTQSTLDKTYMEIAQNFAALSKGVRAKVGAVIVTSSGIMIPGYNGNPVGMSNQLEYEYEGKLVTKQEVIHAELNCVLKAAKEGVSLKGSTVYVTHSPCVHCSAMLINADVGSVKFGLYYKSYDGIKLLKEKGIFTKLITEDLSK